MAPTVNGITYSGLDPMIASATASQNVALTNINNQVLNDCTDIGVTLLTAYSS